MIQLCMIRHRSLAFIARLLEDLASLSSILGNDVYIHLWSALEQPLNGRIIKIFFEAVYGFAPEQNLRNPFLLGERSECAGHGLSFQKNNFCRKIFRKSDVGLKAAPLFRFQLSFVANMHNEQLRVDALGYARAARDQLLRCRTRADAYRNSFLYLPMVAKTFPPQIRIEAAIDRAGYLAQRQFTQRHQVAASKEIGERSFHSVLRINIPALHAHLQRLWRQIRHHHLIRALHHPIGNGLANRDPGDALNCRPQAFDVLNVDRGQNVDLRSQKLQNIFVSLAVLAARNVGMRQLIDQHDIGLALQNRVHVHLLKKRALVFDRFERHTLHLAGQFRRALASVRLDHTGNNVFPAACAADCLAQHVVRLAYARSIAQENFEYPRDLFFRGFFQPVLRRFQRSILFSLPSHVSPLSPSDISLIRTIQRMGTYRMLHLVRYAIGAGVIACITLLDFRFLHANHTTVALSFLLVVLLTAANWGLRPAVFVSLLSTLSFNYFFLPPILTLTIADTRNWVALFAFLMTAVIASHLAENARRQAASAHQRRIEVERLYAVSQQLLVTENPTELLTRIPGEVALVFGLIDVALFTAERNRIYRSSGNSLDMPAARLREAALSREPQTEDSQTIYLPLMLGVRSIGALGLRGPMPSRETVEALSSLIAIAVERVDALEKLTRAEASRESERLRTALLDSITHELRTPLTAIKASITSVRVNPEMDAKDKEEMFAVIEEESDRLNRLIDEAVEMAQLDAREVKLNIRPHAVRAAVEAAIAELAEVLHRNPVELRLPEAMPRAHFDLAYITKVMRHLLENAVKYSAENSPIYVSAEIGEGSLTVNVADRGAGIDDLEQAMIFDKFYRGRQYRGLLPGTGMGLAIVRAIVEAHHGKITCTSQVGQGSVFSFTLPIAY